jgi:hypothetical protein
LGLLLQAIFRANFDAFLPRSVAWAFGGVLTRTTVSGQLNGQIDRHWDAEGLLIRLSVDRSRLG